MDHYKTVAEIGEEWGVTERYVQALCREGRINGAVKRAGVWFIPDNAPNPRNLARNNGNHFRLSGTKKRIFETAAVLFSQKSYEVVSIKDIAEKVGVRQSALYNHFESKQQILDMLYDFFTHYYTKGRATVQELEPVIMNGSVLDLLTGINYEFIEAYRELMLSIYRLIIQRKFIDERARELARTLIVSEGIRYVEEVFDRAIELGRFRPFDTHDMAIFCNSNTYFMFFRYTVDPSDENVEIIFRDQRRLYEFAAKLLERVDLYNNGG